MTKQAKPDLTQMYKDVAEGCGEEGYRQWKSWLVKVRAEDPKVDEIINTQTRHAAFADRIRPWYHSLQRIENGNAEYEEIMGLQK